jgi:nicotinate-nucleotide adenylyltransferase
MEQAIGVLGGSFDPIHYGHLALAQEAAWALGLARVLLVPAARQPLKAEGHGATPEQRLAMVALACADNPLLKPCDIEVRRAGPSYTVDTLRELREQLGEAAGLVFILGVDALHELPRWRGAAELAELCRFAAMSRPGVATDLGAVERALPALRGRVTLIGGPGLEISGTELRRRLAGGMPVRYQLPDAVLDYIERHGLYR